MMRAAHHSTSPRITELTNSTYPTPYKFNIPYTNQQLINIILTNSQYYPYNHPTLQSKLTRFKMKRPSNWKSRLSGYSTQPPSNEAEQYDEEQLTLFLNSKDYHQYLVDTDELKLKHGIGLSTVNNTTYNLGLKIDIEDTRMPNLNYVQYTPTKCDRCWNDCTTVGKYIEHPTLCEYCMNILFNESDNYEKEEVEYYKRRELAKVVDKLNDNVSAKTKEGREKALFMMAFGDKVFVK